MAEAMAIDEAKALTNLVAARAFEEMKLVWGFKDQLQKLRNRFLYIHAFLQDLGCRTHEAEKSQLVNLWLKTVKDAAYSAEDVMDEYGYEMLRRKMELQNRCKNKFRNFFSVSNPIAFRFQMTHKVAKVHALLDQLDKEAKDIGLRQVEIAQASVTDPHNTISKSNREYAAADASQFVGREYDQNKLIEVLCSPANDYRHLSFVAIVGMGGLGKTTLARKVYDSERVDVQFDKRIWICVSDNFDVERLLKEMVESLTSCKCDLSNREAIIKKLEGDLRGRKFLLVLDDVWNTNIEKWDSLKGSLQRIGGLAGSVILISTRNSEVATNAGAVYTHWLTELLDDESWALFKQKVDFNDGRSLKLSGLEDIGRRIVGKCKGVPLAIKVMGALLHSKPYRHEWEVIEKSNIWDLPLDQNEILPSLLLSFNHLPSPSLKQCFAYCGIFPKDFLTSNLDLIWLWNSQGFLQTSETSNLTTEQIGNKYVNFLLSNSLLQFVSVAEYTGEILYLRMHDMVHNLALYVSQKEVMVWDAKDKLDDVVDCRHLTLNHKVEAVSGYSGKVMGKLRTINALCFNVPGEFLIDARYLRALKMTGIGIEEVPSAICGMKHLRYLDLSFNPIKSLPDSITQLYHLQTLVLSNCIHLKELPKDLHKLVNLRAVPTTYPVFVSRGLQGLTCLQYLPYLHLREEGWTIDELGPLNEVVYGICIEGLNHVKSKEEARKAGLGRKTKVSKLWLVWHAERAESSGANTTDEDVLDGLEPHPDMISIQLHNFYGMMLPAWVRRMAVVNGRHGDNPVLLSTLCEVTLFNFRRCKQLPTLGQLPCLKILNLSEFDVDGIGTEFYASTTCESSNSSINTTAADPHMSTAAFFPALTRLEISTFQKLRTWLPPPQSPPAAIAFAHLESLLVVNCPELHTMPALEFPSLRALWIENLGGNQPLDIIIKYNTSLTTLYIKGMLEMTSLPQELSNCRNLQMLDILDCRKLMSLPTGLQCLVSLQHLQIKSCPAVTYLPDDIFSALSSLRTLKIDDLEGLTRIPTSVQGCTSLETLTIKRCPLIEGKVPDLSLFVRLNHLSIFNSGKLMDSLLETAQHLPRLEFLRTGGFREDKELREYFSDVTPLLNLCNQSLKELLVEGSPNSKSLPSQLQHLTRLQRLGIYDFDELEQVPEWIDKLSSLQELDLFNCKNLKYLPSQAVMLRLPQLCLSLRKCPLLAERCENHTKPEWHKISHLPYILIDNEVVQYRR